ncbi:HET domain protein [Penicillium sp. IBT 35674x]|nr:HET domain protein [Penicillium sp. IBT 35674x]
MQIMGDHTMRELPRWNLQQPQCLWTSLGPNVFSSDPEAGLRSSNLELDQCSTVESTWCQKYMPLLVPHHMLLEDPLNSSVRILDGSHVLEATCMGFQQLTDGLKMHEET